MKQATTIPLPTVKIPPQVKQVGPPVVPMSTPLVVPKRTGPISKTTVNVPGITSRIQPVVPSPETNIVNSTVATPVKQAQTPQTLGIKQAQTPQTLDVKQPQTPQTLDSKQRKGLKPIIPQPQGGLLRQFGGGTVKTVNTPYQTTAAPTITIVAETGYSLLVKTLEIWNGNIEKAQQLAALEYLNGTHIIDVKRRDVIIEVIGMLRNQPFEEVIDFLTNAPNPEFILWNQKSLDEGRVKVAREITIQQTERTGIKGVGKCRYCPSTELIFATKQLRSGDEPATVFVRCVMCNKQCRQ